jgi:hypothetical protein
VALWPFVVALVWCCLWVPLFVRSAAKSRELHERYAPLPPPPILRGPTLTDLLMEAPFVLYHLPVLLPLTAIVRSVTNGRLLELSLATIFLTAVLYSALVTWVF